MSDNVEKGPPLAKAVLITGTGTDVGKTFTSLALLHSFERRGIPCAYWKPLQSGAPDEQIIRQFSWKHVKVFDALQSYPTPAAPAHCVSIDTMPNISLMQIQERLQQIRREGIPTIVEGAGGVYAPINTEHDTWIDFLDHVQIPCVLVGTSGLGTINHTTLSIDALCSHHLHGVVLSGELHPMNLASLKKMRPQVEYFQLPQTSTNDLSTLHHLDALADKILSGATPIQNVTEADLRHAWHPYTQHATESTPIEVTQARGSWLYTSEGKLFDATSSWWVNSIGHGRPEIARAIVSQQRRLDHVIYAGVAHAPASRLAERLATLTDLDRCFFSDNGSTAIEVALKMAFQYWRNRGENGRQKFLALHGSYHGDTNACMSVAASSGYHDAFAPLLFDVDFMAPKTSHPSRFTAQPIAELKAQLASSRYAAMIIEPLVQGAGGMLMHDLDWLNAVLAAARDSGTLIIFDEVFVGFGRTGTLFAKDQVTVAPDIVCLSKALTGGNLPLAVTMATRDVFEAFLHDDKSKALLHGHSYTANPIACAAALATLDIYERESLVEKSLEMETIYQSHAENLIPYLENLRIKGAIIAGELRGSGGASYFKRSTLAQEARRLGLFIRPLGNTIYAVPPLTTPPSELRWMLEQLIKVLDTPTK